MQSLDELLQISERPVQGPSPSFEQAHLVLAFLTIGEAKVIGRQVLASRSGLGEGAIRTILKKLREEGYAEANASGCYLTPGGRQVYESVLRKLSPMAAVHGSKLTVGTSTIALAVSGRGRAVKRGIEQRDSAIRLGAEGATTFVYRSGKFTIPGGSSDCERDFPSKAWASLRSSLSPSDGDAVVLCGAQDEITARLGALSAALTLL